MLTELHRRYLPNKVVAYRDPQAATADRSPALAGIFAGKSPLSPGPTVFVCENFACQAPVAGRQAALAVIAEMAGEIPEAAASMPTKSTEPWAAMLAEKNATPRAAEVRNTIAVWLRDWDCSTGTGPRYSRPWVVGSSKG